MLFRKKQAPKQEIDTSHFDRAQEQGKEIIAKLSRLTGSLDEMSQITVTAMDKQKLVLLVEEDVVDANTVKKIFKENGILLHWAGDCERSYKRIMDINPAVILLDGDSDCIHRICEEFGGRIVMVTNHPEMLRQKMGDMVKAIFSKNKMVDAVHFIKTMVGAGPLNRGEPA